VRNFRITFRYISPKPHYAVLLSAEPTVLESTIQTLITVVANLDLPVVEPMSCKFGNVLTSATIIGRTALCNSPLGLTGNSTLQLVGTTTGELWSSIAIPVQFFCTFSDRPRLRLLTLCAACPQFVSRCNEEVCFTSPNCGWCLDTGRCQGRETCRQNNPTNIWVNQTCPFIESVTPDFIQVAPANFTHVPFVF